MRNKYVIKVSGKVLSDLKTFKKLINEIYQMMLLENSFVLIHGGGTILSEYCKRNNITSEFDSEGRRITSVEEMHAADMILSGSLNTNIVRICNAQGMRSIGLSCVDHRIIIGETLNNTHTGVVKSSNVSILEILSQHNILPVLCSVSSTDEGKPLNINADDVARCIASEWKAHNLIFLTDTPGIKIQNSYVQLLNSQEIEHYIQQKEIKDGMVVKVKNALESVSKGAGSVIIGNYKDDGDLQRLIKNEAGTKIIVC